MRIFIEIRNLLKLYIFTFKQLICRKFLYFVSNKEFLRNCILLFQMRSCLLDSPSSSTSALHTQAISPKRIIPARAISQQFDDSHRPPHPSGRRSSTRRAIRRLSRLFHRVRDSFVARIPMWSPVGSPAPENVPKSAPANLPIPTREADKEDQPANNEIHQDKIHSDSEVVVPSEPELPSKVHNEVSLKNNF